MVSPPGDILETTMETHGVDSASLAGRAEIPLSCVEGILSATHPVTEDVADRLEQVFGVTAECWLNLQRNYDSMPHAEPMKATCETCA